MHEFVFVDLIGYLAGSLTTVAFLPQVVKTWRLRSARDLSLAMLSMFTTGGLCWLLYGIALGRWPIILFYSSGNLRRSAPLKC